MRLAWWLPLAGAVLVGCPKDDPKPGAATATATPRVAKTAPAPEIDHDWCKDFMEALEVCAKSPPPGVAASRYREQLSAHRGAYTAAGPVQKAQMQSGCQTGVMTIRQQQPGCGTAKAEPSSTAK